jgi:hypothetical protein
VTATDTGDTFEPRVPHHVGGDDVKTFCNDGATHEPFTLAELREHNAEDEELPTWERDLDQLPVGGTYHIGIGGGWTVVTRLT